MVDTGVKERIRLVSSCMFKRGRKIPEKTRSLTIFLVEITAIGKFHSIAMAGSTQATQTEKEHCSAENTSDDHQKSLVEERGFFLH